MIKGQIRIFIELLIEQSVVKRAFVIALIVGVVLNVINQWEVLLTQSESANYMKVFLTFIVPYLVSSYSSVMSKLSFKVAEVAPINAKLICRTCKNKVISINKGEIVPECPKCSKTTKWSFYSKELSNALDSDSQKDAMAMFAHYNPAPVFRFDRMGKLVMSNSAANQFFGYDIVGNDVR